MTAENNSEKVLIKQAAGGNREALELLLENNYPIVKGYLLKTTLNSSLAEDLTQETMVRAIMNIGKFQPRAKFSSWLITIGNNLYRDHLRKSSREKPLEEGGLAREAAEWGEPEDRVELVRLEGILTALPYEQRAVVVLKHYYQYSYKEIAEIMKCPLGTVRSRLHNGLNFIREELNRRGG